MKHLLILIALLCGTLSAQTLSGEALVKALQQGGYVIVMRHASSPGTVPAGATERQLDDPGKAAATEMGKALRDLKIPIGEVFSSPTQRALETARLAQWTQAKPAPELGDNGQSMSGGTAAQAEWLQKRVAQSPKGTNVLLITHMPNLRGAFPVQATNVADGEALIFGPNTTLVGRVKIEDWEKLKK
jgi:phosphohistidine phosphatase SixA